MWEDLEQCHVRVLVSHVEMRRFDGVAQWWPEDPLRDPHDGRRQPILQVVFWPPPSVMVPECYTSRPCQKEKGRSGERVGEILLSEMRQPLKDTHDRIQPKWDASCGLVHGEWKRQNVERLKGESPKDGGRREGSDEERELISRPVCDPHLLPVRNNWSLWANFRIVWRRKLKPERWRSSF